MFPFSDLVLNCAYNNQISRNLNETVVRLQYMRKVIPNESKLFLRTQ